MLPVSRFGTRPPPPSGTRVNSILWSASVQRARMSEPEPAEVMPTFLPASSDDLLDRRVRSSPPGTSRSSRGAVGDALARSRPSCRPAATLEDGVEDQVGGAGRDRLEALRAAAIDRQLGLDAFLVEQLLADRRLGDDGRDSRSWSARRCARRRRPGRVATRGMTTAAAPPTSIERRRKSGLSFSGSLPICLPPMAISDGSIFVRHIAEGL